jgi:hypothetical protein
MRKSVADCNARACDSRGQVAEQAQSENAGNLSLIPGAVS